MRHRAIAAALTALLSVAAAQMQPGQMSNGPAQPSLPAPDAQGRDIDMHGDGRCLDAHPGDLVHYTLTIESVDAAQGIYGNLLLRPKGAPAVRNTGLLLPDYRTLGGGGLGQRDTASANVFHFVFRVPVQIFSGVYRGAALDVTQNDAASRPQPVRADDDPIDVTRRVRDEVHNFCLNVFSSFGANTRPEVTDFTPGGITRP